jgi:hypothetical protein
MERWTGWRGLYLLGLLLGAWLGPSLARADSGLLKACEVFGLQDAEALVGGGLSVQRLDVPNQGYFFSRDTEDDAVAIPLESYCDYTPAGFVPAEDRVPERKLVVGVYNTFSPEAARTLYDALERDTRTEVEAGREPRLILGSFALEGVGAPAFATERIASPASPEEHLIEAYALKGSVVVFVTAWRKPEVPLDLTRRALDRLLARLQ